MNGELLKNIFQPIIGEPAWLVRLGHGSFLTFEFGRAGIRRIEPTTRKKRRSISVHGEWHLWIYCCRWHVLDNAALLASSNSDQSQMSRAAHFLDGQILRSVSYIPDTMRCRFEFDLGGVLETWLNTDDPAEQWLLYHNQDDVWILNAANELEAAPYDEKTN